MQSQVNRNSAVGNLSPTEKAGYRLCVVMAYFTWIQINPHRIVELAKRNERLSMITSEMEIYEHNLR